MRCPNCQKPIKETFKFCLYCGTDLRNSGVEKATENVNVSGKETISEVQADVDVKSSMSLRTKLCIASIALVIAHYYILLNSPIISERTAEYSYQNFGFYVQRVAMYRLDIFYFHLLNMPHQ